MRKAGNRLAAYLVIALLIVVGVGWYFSTVEGPECEDGDSGCGADIGAIVVGTIVLGTVMPCVVLFGERLSRGPRRRVGPK